MRNVFLSCVCLNFCRKQSVLHKQSLWSLCTSRCSAFKESHRLLDPQHLKHMPTGRPGGCGLMIIPECSPGGHFLPQAVKALPSCPRSLDLKWCRLPHLRYTHGPADLDLACAPQGTFHALISAIPCLSASLQYAASPPALTSF